MRFNRENPRAETTRNILPVAAKYLIRLYKLGVHIVFTQVPHRLWTGFQQLHLRLTKATFMNAWNVKKLNTPRLLDTHSRHHQPASVWGSQGVCLPTVDRKWRHSNTRKDRTPTVSGHNLCQFKLSRSFCQLMVPSEPTCCYLLRHGLLLQSAEFWTFLEWV